MSELAPQRGVTKDGKAVLYHRAKHHRDWVVRADPSGEVLFRGDSEQAIRQWMEQTSPERSCLTCSYRVAGMCEHDGDCDEHEHWTPTSLKCEGEDDA